MCMDNQNYEECLLYESMMEKAKSFYRKVMQDDNEFNQLFESIFQLDERDNTPRRIMNHIYQLVSLADDIDKIRPSRDPLRLFFLRTCQESVYKLYNEKFPDKSRQIKIENFFEDYLSEEGKQYIKENFRLIMVDYHEEPNYITGEYIDNKEGYVMEMADFARVFYMVRGMVTHEGDYWSMQVFAKRDSEYTFVSSVETSERVLDCVKNDKNRKYTYLFETTMNYEKFRDYFVQGCIQILKDYILIVTP